MAPPPSPLLRNSDLLAVRSFVTAQDESQYDNVPDTIVILDLTHSNLQQQHIEIRFAKADTLMTLRDRIHRQTGTAPQHQHLQVMEGNQLLVEIPPETLDTYQLGYFGLLYHGMCVHCLDTNPYSGSAAGAYEDTSLIEKYRMSEQDYEQRSGTLRAWSKQKQQKDPKFTLRQHAAEHRALAEAIRQHKQGLPLREGFFVDASGKVVRDEPDLVVVVSPTSTIVPEEFGFESVRHLTVGERCQVEPGKRRGSVVFVGEVTPPLAGGYWVGVVFDEPVGQNDGSVDGVRYFDAPGERYGGLVRAKNVEVGNFPERDLLDSDSEDEL